MKSCIWSNNVRILSNPCNILMNAYQIPFYLSMCHVCNYTFSRGSIDLNLCFCYLSCDADEVHAILNTNHAQLPAAEIAMTFTSWKDLC